MNSNPLIPIVIFSFLNIAYTIYQILVQGVFKPIGIAGAVAECVFLFLYFVKPKYAGAFMFYSAIPIYPIYFLMGVLGLNANPPSVGTYLFMTLINIAVLFFFWKLKNKYELYLQNEQTDIYDSSPV